MQCWSAPRSDLRSSAPLTSARACHPAAAVAQLAAVLARIDDWQFNTFEVAEATGGRCLSMVAFHLMKKSGWVPGRFGISEHKLARWVGADSAVNFPENATERVSIPYVYSFRWKRIVVSKS